jgi:hypothetical protein
MREKKRGWNWKEKKNEERQKIELKEGKENK